MDSFVVGGTMAQQVPLRSGVQEIVKQVEQVEDHIDGLLFFRGARIVPAEENSPFMTLRRVLSVSGDGTS